jgi:hypothetical protein
MEDFFGNFTADFRRELEAWLAIASDLWLVNRGDDKIFLVHPEFLATAENLTILKHKNGLKQLEAVSHKA